MPRYQITTAYSSPAELAPDAHRAVGQAVEAAAVAALRVATGEGRVPVSVADALALVRAWYAAEALGLPLVVAAGLPAAAQVGD